eukprot:scaffold67571_cov63-Phaeocystis_antarctica.AAC.2
MVNAWHVHGTCNGIVQGMCSGMCNGMCMACARHVHVLCMASSDEGGAGRRGVARAPHFAADLVLGDELVLLPRRGFRDAVCRRDCDPSIAVAGVAGRVAPYGVYALAALALDVE